MFFIAYTFKGQVHVFTGQVKIVSHTSCRTSTILKYFCPLVVLCIFLFLKLSCCKRMRGVCSRLVVEDEGCLQSFSVRG